MAHSADTKPTWPQCGEPYAASLKQFAQRWIDGEISDGDLALEILELQQQVTFAEREAREDGRRVPSSLGLARREIDILGQVVADHHDSPLAEPPTREARQITFDVILADCRNAEAHPRGRQR